MTSLWRIFWLETVALWRGGTAALLLAASLGWLTLLPRVLVGDGTPEGFREMFIRYGLGGVFALLLVSLLAAATGSIATEREAKRLQMTQVRPVPLAMIAWGKFLALTALGALVLACAAPITVSFVGADRRCNHVYRPVMESPREEAERMYDVYMADPDTPAEVKKAKRAAIVRMLAQRAADRYDTVQTNSVATWEFPADIAAGPVSARFKFTNMFDMRADVRGRIVFGEATGCVSNITRTAVVVSLEGDGSSGTRMTFENLGSDALMFRPRQDVELLVAADGFTENLFRCLAELVAILALIVAFGVFLGAGLSRPVALFTGMIVLAAGEISPSVIDQYPDKMETDRIDRIGLVITRAVERITRPVGSLSPLGRLADDDCVEAREVLSAFGYDFVLLPIVLSLIAGFLISRKCE